MDLAVVLIAERRNWNSLQALAGALEADPRCQGMDVSFVAPGAAAAQIDVLAATHERVVAGFSFMSPDLVRVAGQVAGLPRERWPNLTLVAGGPHATASWRSTLALGFDYAVVGDGEAAFPELLWQVASHGHARGVQGVAYRDPAGGLAHNGRARPVSLVDYPPFSVRYRRMGPIELTRGCPHRCRFCAAPFLAGRQPRHRPLAAVLSAVEAGLRHGIDQVRFVAPDSFAYGSAGDGPRFDLLEELLRVTSGLAGRENVFLGSFPSEVRPESVTRRAVELVARYCGNDNLVIGAQSGSERLLARMQRGHSADDVRRAVAITQASGLQANVDIIFGLPGETADDRQETLRLIDELAQGGARIHSHTFMPLPGSAWARCAPGAVDDVTARWLGALASQGRQYGSWQKQEAQARQMVEFLAQLEAQAQAPQGHPSGGQER